MIIKRIQEWKTDSERIDQHNENDAEMISLKEDTDKSFTRNNLDESFESAGISTLKFHAISSHSKISFSERKMKRVFDSITEQVKLMNMTSLCCKSFDSFSIT